MEYKTAFKLRSETKKFEWYDTNGKTRRDDCSSIEQMDKGAGMELFCNVDDILRKYGSIYAASQRTISQACEECLREMYAFLCSGEAQTQGIPFSRFAKIGRRQTRRRIIQYSIQELDKNLQQLCRGEYRPPQKQFFTLPFK
jgi:hypothetical protein